MPTKDLDTRTGRYTVAFRLPPEAGVEQAWLAGDFNGWSTEDCPMHREADGGMLAVVEDLQPGAELRFRYYLGDGAWENDWAADAYVGNEFGGADSLLVLPAVESPPPEVKAPSTGGNGHRTSPIEAAAEAAPLVEAVATGDVDELLAPATPVVPELAPADAAPAKKAAAAKKPAAKKAAAKEKKPAAKKAAAKKAAAKKAAATAAGTQEAARKAAPKPLEPPPGTDSA